MSTVPPFEKALAGFSQGFFLIGAGHALSLLRPRLPPLHKSFDTLASLEERPEVGFSPATLTSIAPKEGWER